MLVKTKKSLKKYSGNYVLNFEDPRKVSFNFLELFLGGKSSMKPKDRVSFTIIFLKLSIWINLQYLGISCFVQIWDQTKKAYKAKELLFFYKKNRIIIRENNSLEYVDRIFRWCFQRIYITLIGLNIRTLGPNMWQKHRPIMDQRCPNIQASNKYLYITLAKLNGLSMDQT